MTFQQPWRDISQVCSSLTMKNREIMYRQLQSAVIKSRIIINSNWQMCDDRARERAHYDMNNKPDRCRADCWSVGEVFDRNSINRKSAVIGVRRAAACLIKVTHFPGWQIALLVGPGSSSYASDLQGWSDLLWNQVVVFFVVMRLSMIFLVIKISHHVRGGAFWCMQNFPIFLSEKYIEETFDGWVCSPWQYTKHHRFVYLQNVWSPCTAAVVRCNYHVVLAQVR